MTDKPNTALTYDIHNPGTKFALQKLDISLGYPDINLPKKGDVWHDGEKTFIIVVSLTQYDILVGFYKNGIKYEILFDEFPYMLRSINNIYAYGRLKTEN